MALVVNTNVASITSQMYVNQTNKDMADTMARLSSGKRINTAADDAAGVAIASRLESEVRGTNQAIRNAQDAQGLIDTAEGAHLEVVNLLQRMRELAVQAANDTNSADDRTALENEVDQLADEIDRISATTTWAGKSLLNGDSTNVGTVNTTASLASALTFNFQIASMDEGSEHQITATISNIGATSIGVFGLSLASAASAAASMSLIDNALDNINTQRATLGAVSNRLDSTVSNLSNIAANTEAARSGIEDADFAMESANLAKYQIMLQAGTAMLAQANASQQNVLSLLS
jgi:flagellin